MAENYLHEQGEGEWVICVYNPANLIIGPFKGVLKVSKEFHQVDEKEHCLVSIPSQNVGYCVNTSFSKNATYKLDK